MAKKTNSISLRNALGNPISKEKIIDRLKKTPDLWNKYIRFPPDKQYELLSFMSGQKGVDILYNVFFMKIFDPQTQRKRLEQLISVLLGKKVKIKAALPREGSQLAEKGSFVVMDILVELEDGSTFNLEVQKIGYKFPGQRSSCYVSDLIMREYNRLRSKTDKEHPFDYRKMEPVQLLVLMQDSLPEFKAVAPHYMHIRETKYSSGAILKELDHITYISLDTFRDVVQNNVDSELHAWLTFLCNNEPEAILNLITAYPEFISIYQEIARFRQSPEEVIGMYSEALLEMDRNTERYMVEEARQQVEAIKLERDQAFKELDDATRQLDSAQSEITRLKTLLTENNISIDNI